MKRKSRRLTIAGILTAAGLLVMTGCGGGEAERVTVAKQLAPGSLVPPENMSEAVVQELTRLGVPSFGKKCARLKPFLDSDGFPLLTVGGSGTWMLLVEIDASDLGRASQAGYVNASGDFMKSVAKTFDCELRSM